jgi:hypothetical protein
VPVFAIFQRLVEAAGGGEGGGTNDHDAAIDDEIAGGQPRQHLARWLGAAPQQAAPADRAAILVDAIVVAIDGDGLRRRHRGIQQRRNGAGAQAVIGIEEHEPFAGRRARADVAGSGDAAAVIRHQPDSAVPEAAHDGSGPIARSVVDDDERVDIEALRQHARDRLADVGRGVPGWHYDGYGSDLETPQSMTALGSLPAEIVDHAPQRLGPVVLVERQRPIEEAVLALVPGRYPRIPVRDAPSGNDRRPHGGKHRFEKIMRARRRWRRGRLSVRAGCRR